MSTPPAATLSGESLTKWLTQLAGNFPAGRLLTEHNDLAPWLTDWRKRYTGKALAMLLPHSTDECEQMIKACLAAGVTITPQGGNTGLVGGAVPGLEDSRPAVLLSTRQLRETLQVDPINRCLIASAGFTLQECQQAAEQAGLYLPLSLASEGSCTLGGNLATNAGGTAVLRYGSARKLCLGLSAILANGDRWQSPMTLRKNNAGYDLSQWLIGSEGTLGLICSASMQLFSRPRWTLTGWASTAKIASAIDAFLRIKQHFDHELVAFEWINNPTLNLLADAGHHLPLAHLDQGSDAVLFELHSGIADESVHHALQESVEKLLSTLLDEGLFEDLVLATSHAQSQSLWQLRETIPIEQARLGLNIKHDIALPLDNMAQFVEQSSQTVQSITGGCKIIAFGHLGDGNLHYNIAAPASDQHADFLRLHETAIQENIFDRVHQSGGSIAAEHGIGLLRRDKLATLAPPAALAWMGAIKQALDPHQHWNPGKVLLSRQGHIAH